MYANIHYNANQNKIYLWEYDKNGKRQLITNDYQAYCFVYDDSGTYKDLLGRKCRRKDFKDYYAQKDYVKEHQTLEGDIAPESRFLIDRYHAVDLVSHLPKLHIQIIDIEVSMLAGIPTPTNPGSQITAISVYSSFAQKYTTFCMKPYNGLLKHEIVICTDEKDLLVKYFKFHRSNHPDILTGWNVEGFDITYILKRAEYLFGQEFPKKYSPLNQVSFRKFMDEEYPEIAGITVLDYMALYKKYSLNESESYSLDFIAKKELKKQKVKYAGTIDDMYRTDFNRFIEYNINDVFLVKKLHEKLDFIGLWQVQAYFSKVPMHKVGSAIRKFDNYMISQLKPLKVVVPTAVKKQAVEIVGAYVHEPQIGYYPYVVSYDFTSLYPHLMFAINISPETYVGKITSAEGMEFSDIDVTMIAPDKIYHLNGEQRTGRELKEIISLNKYIISANGLLFKPEFGAVPRAVKGIFDKRKEFKDIKIKEEKLYESTHDEAHKINGEKYDLFQNAVKILANSAYGILANENFRFYNTDWASAVTLTGQKIIKYTINAVNQLFRERFGIQFDAVIAADTDSVYINFEPLVKKYNLTRETFPTASNLFCEKVMKPFFTEIYNKFSQEFMNNPKNWFNMKQEATAIGGIFTKKKKYALYVIASEGVVYSKPKLKVKGIEMVRSSTPPFCRDKIEKVIEEMMLHMDLGRVKDMLRNIRDEFMKSPVAEIAFPRSVNNYNDYVTANGLASGTPIALRAAYNYNTMVERKGLTHKYPYIKSGQKLRFIYMHSGRKYTDNIMGFIDEIPKEFDIDSEVDYETQFDKSFMSAILSLAEAVGWGNYIDLDSQTLDIW